MQALQSFWAELSPYLDFHKVDGLHEPGLGSKHAGVEASPGSGDDLPASTVDGIGMQGHIVHIEANTTHVLLTQDPLGKGSRLSSSSGDRRQPIPACSAPSAYWYLLVSELTGVPWEWVLEQQAPRSYSAFYLPYQRISYSYLQFISTTSQSTEAFY